MALTEQERAQLQARAAGLREEVSTTRAEADVALQEKAQEINDEKLIAEVANLEAARDAAIEVKARVTSGTATDAIAVMNAAAGVPVESVTEVIIEVTADTPVAPVANELGDPFAAEGGSN